MDTLDRSDDNGKADSQDVLDRANPKWVRNTLLGLVVTFGSLLIGYLLQWPHLLAVTLGSLVWTSLNVVVVYMALRHPELVGRFLSSR